MEVRLTLHHTVVTGMTQLSGKTTTLEAIIARSKLRAIAFRTKRGESGFSSYNPLPPFFIQQSDWRYVSSILEAMLRERMKFERSWIMKATKGARSLQQVYENVKSLREKARKDSISESVFLTLETYLAEIIPQIEKFNFVKELSLIEGINVMDLSEMTLEMRSLVIRSVMEYVIDHMNNVVVVIPEAWEYIPQSRATPVKLYAEAFIRKGAAIGNFLFVDSQDIAGIDKTPLRQCDNWIMGRQKETHEVDRVKEVLGKTISAEEIKALPLGTFYASLGDILKKVYVLPANVPEEMGRRVAVGELQPDDIRAYVDEMRGGDETLWKARYEEELERRRVLESEAKVLKEKIGHLDDMLLSFEQEGTLNKQQVDELLAKTIEDLRAIGRTREQDYQRTIDSLQRRMDQVAASLRDTLEGILRELDEITPMPISPIPETVTKTEDIKPDVSEKPRRKTRAHGGSTEEPKSAPPWLKVWWPKLEGIQQRILRYLVDKYPAELTKSEIGFGTGYVSSGGTFNQALSQLVRWKLVRLLNKKYKVVEAPP